MNDRWTEETEQLVADVLDRWTEDSRTYYAGGFFPNDRDNATEAVLAALAEAGLLLQPGGQTATQWRVVYPDRVQPERTITWAYSGSRERADADLRAAIESGWPAAQIENRAMVLWPDGSSHEGAWLPVEGGAS